VRGEPSMYSTCAMASKFCIILFVLGELGSRICTCSTAGCRAVYIGLHIGDFQLTILDDGRRY
jgi:hypothetical protein